MPGPPRELRVRLAGLGPLEGPAPPFGRQLHLQNICAGGVATGEDAGSICPGPRPREDPPATSDLPLQASVPDI